MEKLVYYFRGRSLGGFTSVSPGWAASKVSHASVASISGDPASMKDSRGCHASSPLGYPFHTVYHSSRPWLVLRPMTALTSHSFDGSTIRVRFVRGILFKGGRDVIEGVCAPGSETSSALVPCFFYQIRASSELRM